MTQKVRKRRMKRGLFELVLNCSIFVSACMSGVFPFSGGEFLNLFALV
jgi:hypothetical protein